MIREDLAVELRALIEYARSKEKPRNSQAIAVHFNGTPTMVAMHVPPSIGTEQKGVHFDHV